MGQRVWTGCSSLTELCQHRAFRWLMMAIAACVVFRLGFEVGKLQESRQPMVRLLPGEFEHHDALLMAWSADESHHEALGEITAAIWQRIRVILLVAERHQDVAVEVLERQRVPRDAVTLIPMEVSLPWVRDYGPLQVKSASGRFELLDLDCFDASQPSHDDVPQRVGAAFLQPVVHIPIALEGGNLLSNGAGFCLTTDKVLKRNRGLGLSRAEVTRTLRRQFGANQIVYLEPLQGEPTQHVDMFATFVAPDVLVMGEYDPADDPINAALLDRNSERLANIITAAGKLHVHRIPMPRRRDDRWYSYTNVVFANGILLVPSYGAAHAEREQQALAVYRKLLPEWQVVPIDAESLIERQGALHCVALGLSQLPQRLLETARQTWR